ncbi:hypothetical protein CEXT_519071 [Caerostris extrusa]|uniref:Uncharacterized protein n=1 Tax=Caerostris extrusa TaxID=172846 RepID=A0AAV4RKA3_CAEEX|nr:hypothetical protein CEXT_519071 [Caerostris extrusa]
MDKTLLQTVTASNIFKIYFSLPVSDILPLHPLATTPDQRLLSSPASPKCSPAVLAPFAVNPNLTVDVHSMEGTAKDVNETAAFTTRDRMKNRYYHAHVELIEVIRCIN